MLLWTADVSSSTVKSQRLNSESFTFPHHTFSWILNSKLVVMSLNLWKLREIFLLQMKTTSSWSKCERFSLLSVNTKKISTFTSRVDAFLILGVTILFKLNKKKLSTSLSCLFPSQVEVCSELLTEVLNSDKAGYKEHKHKRTGSY